MAQYFRKYGERLAGKAKRMATCVVHAGEMLETIRLRIAQVLYEDKIELSGGVDFDSTFVVALSAAIESLSWLQLHDFCKFSQVADRVDSQSDS
jgi:hypothetical protein